jgi:hypothetical protein
MSKRLAIYVEDDIPDKLLELVDSPRKQGEFISGLVRSVWENQQVGHGATLDSLRLQLIGLIAEVQELKGRTVALEGRMVRKPG